MKQGWKVKELIEGSHFLVVAKREQRLLSWWIWWRKNVIVLTRTVSPREK